MFRKQVFPIVYIASFLLCGNFDVYAGHRPGGWYTWECIGSNTYVITFTRITNCNKNLEKDASYCLTGSLGGDPNNGTYNVDSAYSIAHPVAFCTGAKICEKNGYNWPYEVVYIDTIVLTPFSPSYTISYCDAGQRPNADNGSGGFHIEASFDTVAPCNSSAYSTTFPDRFYCPGDTACINNNFVDPDGDSLVFYLGDCYNFTYNGGFSGADPMTSTIGWLIDSAGNICFLPPAIESGYVCLVIEEWRGGVKIAESIKEVLVDVIDCSVLAESPLVPSFTVDLTGNPDSAWISPDTIRDGSVCSAPCTDNCIEFIVTLDPGSEAIIFDIYSGAVPPGALFYQIDCSSPTPVGEAICLAGVGPHRITFCKPGDNTNEYTVISIPKPSASTDIGVNDGCTGTLFAYGYDVSTISWTSVFPDSIGDYNSYLSCLFACDSTVATGDAFAPPFVDYQVCGAPVGGCDSLITVCDTARVYFNTELFANILPVIPTICFGDTSVTITANGIGGTPPYSWLWSTGDTTQSIDVDTGTYWIMVSDTSYPGCPPTFDTVVVTSFTSTITANAGADQTVCINNDSIQLSGTITGASGGVWSGGSGTFIPAADSLNTIYMPDSVEIAGGSVTLMLTTTGNGSCPADTDSVIIAIINIDSIGIIRTNLTCNGVCSGSAAATPYGGSSPYTYQWNDPASQTVQTATGLCADTFNVIVTDSNGCYLTTNIIITEPAPFTYTLETNGFLECEDDCDGEIELDDVTGGTSPYTFSWSPPGFTVDLHGDGEGVEYEDICTGGVYTVTTTDANGCSFADSIELIEPNSLVPAIVSITNVTCNGLCDGQAAVSVSGGTPSYDFNWSPTGGNSATATGLCFGIYTVFIEDDNDCDTTLTITIIEPPLLSGSITTILNTSCNGGNDGEATVIPSGGTPSYTYLWNDTANQITVTATGLSAGTYTVTVTDSSGCITTVDAVINEPAILAVVISDSTNVSCNGGNDGTATVSATGGTPLYTYLWSTSPAQTTVTATGLAVGTYSITVTDAKGCSTTANITINEPSPLIATITSATDVSCFGGVDGDATATAINGTSPYTYSWNTNPVQTNATATGLSAGIYTATITDTNGCNATANVIINNPSPLALTITIVTVPSNCGASDGEACVSASGGVPPYSYFWNTTPVQNTACATGLPTGSIDVIVSDSNGCAIVGTSVIGDLNVVITLDSIEDVTCYGGNDGQVWITVSGATPPYTYLWDDPNSQTTSTASGLTAGTYSVTVTDPNNCLSALSITVNQPLPIIGSIAITDLACFGDQNGQATATTSGEYPPYTYSWNTSPVQTLATATGLSAGNYTLTVTDAIGCDTSVNVNVSQPNLLTANISSINVSCNGANDGFATVTATGGVAPYSYLWNPGGQTTAVANNLQPLSYTVTVTDSNGCDTTATVAITEPNILTINLTSADVSCNGLCDGQATANTSGGTPGYTYFWTTTPFQSNAAATGLCPGNYTVTVLDFNGCDTTANTTITEPPLLTASITSVNHVTCNGGNDGDATVTPSGGTLPYTYSWNDPSSQTDSTANSLYAGTYTVTVTDANGCSVLKTVTIAEPTLLTANITGSTNVSCNGAGDGEATVSGGGGTPPYSYSWNTTPFQSTATADSLPPGTYTVTVTDVNGCDTVANINITEPAVLMASISDSSDVSCYGAGNGSITVAVTGGTTAYSYLWNDISAQTTVTASGLTPGSYTVIVTDNNGCDTMVSASITEPPLLIHNITSVIDVGCNGACDGMASVAASGGTPGYTYVWNTTPFQSNATATGLCPGAYTITVTDTNGCVTSDTITIIEPSVLTASVDPPIIHVKCKGGSSGEATVIASGGTTPYSYAWDDPLTQSTATATGLTAGTYTVVITDSNNCNSTGNVTVTINEPAQFLTIGITDSLDVSCNGGSDGEATALASGGTPFYTYAWGIVPAQYTATATGLSAGVYTVTVLDGNGCDASATVNIGEPTALIATITDSVEVSCKNGNDGSATLTASGGTPPYLYSWNTNPTQTNTVATGLVSGTYTATVSDSNNCSTSTSISIAEPDSLLLPIAITDANCGNPDGAASVAVTGGTPPYSYLWSPGGITNDSITGVFSGVYSVNVTDSMGCTDSAVALVNDIVVFILQDSTEDLTCYAGSDGKIKITITSGTPPFDYVWSNGDSTINTSSPVDSLVGLTSGIYYVAVRDSNNCQSSKQMSISGPVAILDSIYIQNVTCKGDSNGQISVFAVGGTPPYTYLWSTIPPQTDSFATSLTAGIYNVTITDTLGCDTISSITISEPDSMIAAIINVTNTSCVGSCDGTATVTGLGGTAPYGYSWNTSPVKTDSIATGLCPGTYTVTLMDMNGCLTYTDTSITDPDSLSASITNVVNVSCNGYSDGQATVTATGGTPGYNYLWAITPVQTDSTATGLEPITHTVTVTDTNGCSTTASVSITEPSVFAASLGSVTHVGCNGGLDGSASVIPFGGTTPYSYSWSTVPVQTDSIATGLSAGTDTAIVSDFNGCSDTVTATINEPPLLTVSITDSINVSCFGGSDGEATVTAVGGSGLYAYLWNDPGTQTTQTATGLSAGTYNVSVTDDNGCDTAASITIAEPPLLTVSVTDSINVSCNGGNDGSVSVSVSGGTTPYTYLWDDNSTQTTDSAFALIAGVYTVTITDTMGCDTTATDTITEPSLLIAVISGITNVNCKGGNTGSATVNVSGGTSPYTYLWDDSNTQTDSIATNLAAGTFNIIVTDAMGCDTTISAIVTEPDSLILSIANITDVACYGDSTGEATASVSGGTLPYTYLWNTPDTISQNDSMVTGLPAGTYAVTVTDTLGCVDNDSVIITEPLDILISVSNDTLICTGDNALISVFASGGSGALTYTWSDTSLSGAGPFNVSPEDTTTYTLTVTDSLGCESIDSIKVRVGPVIIIFAIDDSICVGDSTTISAIVTGGDGNYSYLWETGDTTNAITVNPTISTYYTLTVDDGCATPPETDSVLVEVNPYPVIGLLPPFASACESATIGFIDIIADIPGSTYFWDFGDGSKDTTTNPSVNHTYNNTGIFNVSVTVMSPKGCPTDSTNASTVVISALPTANFDADLIDTAIAQPTVAFTDLSLGNSIIGDTISSWYWDFGDGDTSTMQHPTHAYADTGTYNVLLAIINEYGCPDTIVKTILSCSNQQPNIDTLVLSSLPLITCTANPPVASSTYPKVFTVNFTAGYYVNQYHWDFGDFGDDDTSNLKDPVYIYEDTGTYNVSLTVINKYKCVNTCSLSVIIEPLFEIKVPNAFTPDPNGPNGGAYDYNIFDNNVFFPITDFVNEFHMMIFNRWGELVFESFDLNIGWDGYYRGQLSQQDAYAWKIEVKFINGKEVKMVGDVTLIR